MAASHASKSRVDAEELGINLASRRSPELFKWLVACLLFGKPVQQEVAGRAFIELEHARLTNPTASRKAGWQRLVNVLGKAHYVRYDESTATRLLQAADTLNECNGGSARNILRDAHSRAELSQRLQQFNGIGPKTSHIFIRDLAKAGWRPS